MSDTRLRELERRWKESGAIDDELAYVKERMRTGGLDQRRVELAAWCGHEASKRLTRTFPDEPLVKNWVYRLHSLFGTSAVDRVAITVAKLLLPLWEGNFANDRRVRAALEAACERVRSPSEQADATARTAADAAGAAAEGARGVQVGPLQGVPALKSATPAEVLHWIALAARNAALPATGLPTHVATSTAQAALILGEAQVRAALCEALRRWALDGVEP
jgi:hypothetical protein